jgi:CubicO group peptidase (beta-lactamase class C family)
VLLLLLSACASIAPTPTSTARTSGPTAPTSVAPDVPMSTPAASAPSDPTSNAPVGDATMQADAMFTDPQGRFSVTIPTGWIADQRDDVLTLSDPAGQIRAYALVVANGDPQAALAEAWRRVDPTWALEPVDVQEPPATGGVERVVITSYDAGDAQRVLTGHGRLYQGATYVLLVDADATALERRAAQAAIVESGFTISALPVVDLRGVTPARVDVAITSELAAFTERLLAQFGVPGAAVAVVQGGEVVYLNGFGVRNAATGEPLTPQTRMMPGSTGKSLTTMMMATLVDDGTFSWDTPAQQILPSFAVQDPALSAQITMRNLVCACTGVPRRDFEIAFNGNELSAEEFVASLRSFEFYTPIGEAFQYSNQLVASGGYIAAVADPTSSGSLLEDYAATLQARVLDPIGMPNTTLSFDDVEASGNYAVPHSRRLAVDAPYEPRPLRSETVLGAGAPAGVHWSTAEDMARYLVTELSRGVAPDGTRVVSAQQLEETWRPQVPVSATEQYGLGWFVGNYKGQRLIHHGGNTFGFTSDFAFLPDADIGILVLANGQGTNAMNEAIRTRLWELVFAQEAEAEAVATYALEQATAQTTSFAAQLGDSVDTAAISPFLGRYTNEALGEVILSLEGDALTLDAGEFRLQLLPLRGAESQTQGYLIVDPPVAGVNVTFADAGGQPTLTLASDGLEPYTFIKVE